MGFDILKVPISQSTASPESVQDPNLVRIACDYFVEVEVFELMLLESYIEAGNEGCFDSGAVMFRSTCHPCNEGRRGCLWHYLQVEGYSEICKIVVRQKSQVMYRCVAYPQIQKYL